MKSYSLNSFYEQIFAVHILFQFEKIVSLLKNEHFQISICIHTSLYGDFKLLLLFLSIAT